MTWREPINSIRSDMRRNFFYWCIPSSTLPSFTSCWCLKLNLNNYNYVFNTIKNNICILTWLRSLYWILKNLIGKPLLASTDHLTITLSSESLVTCGWDGGIISVNQKFNLSKYISCIRSKIYDYITSTSFPSVSVTRHSVRFWINLFFNWILKHSQYNMYHYNT